MRYSKSGLCFTQLHCCKKLCILKMLPSFVKEYPNGFRWPEFLDNLCISDFE